jgi:hypothetical protein
MTGIEAVGMASMSAASRLIRLFAEKDHESPYDGWYHDIAGDDGDAYVEVQSDAKISS